MACRPESIEAAIVMVAKNAPQVAAARLGPNLTRLCWIDESDVLHSRDWFIYRGDESDEHAELAIFSARSLGCANSPRCWAGPTR